MRAGGYFVNLTALPDWIAALRYTSFWYYSLGLFLAFALPTNADHDAWPTHGANGTQSTLERYSFSAWSWEGAPYKDVLVLLAFVLVHRTAAFIALCMSKKLQFS